MLVKFLHSHKIALQIAGKVLVLVVKILLVYLFVCLSVCLYVFCLLCLAVLGLACLAWGVFLPLLALLVIAGVVQRCLFSAWRYLALLGFAGVAGRSCTLPFANALSVPFLARWDGSGTLGMPAWATDRLGYSTI